MRYRAKQSWKNIRNPWTKIKKGCYVLNREKDAAGSQKYKFQTALPPQPFQGNPAAPIWILMLNPCYSTDDKEYYEKNAERRQAILGQLKFRKRAKHFHYVLDNAEDNFSRQWFENRFLKNKDMGLTADNVDKKIFILQACGYASEKFNGDLKNMVKDFPHLEYAHKLARWGLRNGKTIVIARSRKYWQEVLQPAMKEGNTSKIYFLCSYLNISFSFGNIISYKRFTEVRHNKKEYSKAKVESAQELKDIIENQ